MNKYGEKLPYAGSVQIPCVSAVSGVKTNRLGWQELTGLEHLSQIA